MMAASIGNRTDFAAGCLFIAVGVSTAAAAYAYPFGTSMRMGPGYFPFLLGVLLAGLGLVLALTSLTFTAPRRHGPSVKPPLIAAAAIAAFVVLLGLLGRRGVTGIDIPIIVAVAIVWFASRELFWVLLSVVAFAIGLNHLGVFIALLLSIVIITRASSDISLRDLLAVSVVLLVLVKLAFATILDLNLPSWPRVPGFGGY
ncbi:MAG: hypothetical protein FJX60_04000 [Alphaproteobacteria bacterium]|nr:hypothetical protein [Alphaproteobacteria bacterium]